MFRKVPPIAFPIEARDFAQVLKWPGDALTAFEESFAEAFDLSRCFALSSGRAALTLVLRMLKEVKPEKADVIIPAYTCPTVPLSVARAGLKVKLCDISVETLNIDASLLEHIVDGSTLCVVAPHMFGFPCDMENILEVVDDNDVFLVEDVAQAAGAKWNGRMLGEFGHLACFSLGRGKSLTTYEGGVLGVGRNAEFLENPLERLLGPLNRPGFFDSAKILAQLLAMWFLQGPRAWWFISRLPLGFEQQYHSINFRIERLGSCQRAFGTSVLQRLDSINAVRRSNGRYLAERLRDVKDISIPKELEGAEAVYLRLPVVFGNRETREEMYRQLSRAGIGASRAYVNSLNRYDYLAHIVPRGDYPAAEYVAERILTLPTHPLMSQTDLDTIVDVFRNV